MEWISLAARLLSPTTQPRRRIVYEAVFQRIIHNGYANPLELAKDIEVPLRTIQRYLKDLVERGVLERRREGKRGKWQYVWGPEIEYFIRKGYDIIIRKKVT